MIRIRKYKSFIEDIKLYRLTKWYEKWLNENPGLLDDYHNLKSAVEFARTGVPMELYQYYVAKIKFIRIVARLEKLLADQGPDIALFLYDNDEGHIYLLGAPSCPEGMFDFVPDLNASGKFKFTACGRAITLRRVVSCDFEKDLIPEAAAPLLKMGYKSSWTVPFYIDDIDYPVGAFTLYFKEVKDHPRYKDIQLLKDTARDCRQELDLILSDLDKYKTDCKSELI